MNITLREPPSAYQIQGDSLRLRFIFETSMAAINQVPYDHWNLIPQIMILWISGNQTKANDEVYKHIPNFDTNVTSNS
jgi:hypothetical protein